MSDSKINSYEDLEIFFTSAFKTSDQWQMGMEFEKMGVHPETGRAVSFSGPDGVEAILKELSNRFDWSPIYEGKRVVSLERGKSRITLEPGAQLELSAEPYETLHDLALQNELHLQELREVTDPKKIVWLGIGCQPISEWDEIELLPKERYAIMNRYLPQHGELAWYEEIPWLTSVQEAREKAASEGKPLLIWCSADGQPCGAT